MGESYGKHGALVVGATLTQVGIVLLCNTPDSDAKFTGRNQFTSPWGVSRREIGHGINRTGFWPQ